MLIADYDPDLAEERAAARATIQTKVETTAKFVVNLIKDNIPIEKICVYTGLTTEDIEKLQAELQTEAE